MVRLLRLVGVVLLLAAALWLVLHLWPTSDSVEKANAAPVRLYPPGCKFCGAYQDPHNRSTAVGKAYYLWQTGHPRAARKTLRDAYGDDHWNRIPAHTSYRWNPGYPRRLERGDCATPGWTVSVSADVIGVTLFSATYRQHFCWGGGRITDLRAMTATGNVHGFGEFLNWSDEGVVGAAGDWTGRKGHVGVRVYRFHECTPTPLGCIFGRDDDITGAISVIYTGRAWFNR